MPTPTCMSGHRFSTGLSVSVPVVQSLSSQRFLVAVGTLTCANPAGAHTHTRKTEHSYYLCVCLVYTMVFTGKRCRHKLCTNERERERRATRQTDRQTDRLDPCEGQTFSTAIFNSDIELSFLVPLFVFYICFVRLSLC